MALVVFKSLRAAGSRTIAQDEESCVVFGMPQAAIKLGAAEEVVTPSADAAKPFSGLSRRPVAMKPELPIPELGGVVASALAEVLATQFKLPVIASDTPSADQSEQCLIGTVKLTGELLSGDVKLELPEAFVAKITAALHGSERGDVSRTKRLWT